MRKIELPGGRHAVLVLLGLMGNPLEMQFIGRKLQEAGYTVVIPLIPGYGYTSGQKEDHRLIHCEKWYAEVQARFDDLKRRSESVSIVGLCVGAALGLRLAAERPDDVAAISVLSTTLYFDGWSVPWYQFMLPLIYHTPLRHLYTYKERYPYGLKNDTLRKWVVREMKAATATTSASGFSAEGLFQTQRLIKKVRKTLDKVRCPTLIIHAKEDDVATPRSANLVESRISSAT